MECEHCDETARFWVEESYLSEDGEVGVDRLEAVCVDCVEEAEPEGMREPFGPNYSYEISIITDDLY